MQADRKRGVRLVVTLAVLALATAGAALAATHPKVGAYAGFSKPGVKGGQPRHFLVRVAPGKCAPAGFTVKRSAYCASISPLNLIEARCASGVVNPYYFPVTVPIALSPTGRISHQYKLYHLMAGEAYARHVPGSTRFGSFTLNLRVDAKGHATGSMRYRIAGGPGVGVCDSRVVKIAARFHK